MTKSSWDEDEKRIATYLAVEVHGVVNRKPDSLLEASRNICLWQVTGDSQRRIQTRTSRRRQVNPDQRETCPEGGRPKGGRSVGLERQQLGRRPGARREDGARRVLVREGTAAGHSLGKHAQRAGPREHNLVAVGRHGHVGRVQCRPRSIPRMVLIGRRSGTGRYTTAGELGASCRRRNPVGAAGEYRGAAGGGDG